MAKLVRNVGRALWIVLPLLAVAVFLVMPQRHVQAATYSNPFWTNPPAGCACDSSCCEAPSLYSPEGVNYIDGTLDLKFQICNYPGTVEQNAYFLTYKGGITGGSQFGNNVIPNWLVTVEKIIDIPGNPNANGGNHALVRFSNGLIKQHNWNGSAYVAQSCGDTDVLTTSLGNFVLTDKWGNVLHFTSDGMPDDSTDRNGNQDNYTFSSYSQTGLSDERGHGLTPATNGNGFIYSLTGSPAVGFGYDSNGNLTSITYPSTPDQTGGATVTLGYDGSNRLTSIQDARSNTVRTFTYVGGTRQIDSLSIDGDVVDFSYTGGRTDRTDRNGGVHRIYYSGNNITKTEMFVGGVPKYVTTYAYSGNSLITIVYPRGNRVDFTLDGMNNVTERRRKTTNTSSTNSSDIVETWAYTNNFVTSYTDPLGNVTSYTRDGAGNVTTISYPNVTNPAAQNSVTKTMTYNGYGQVTQVTDEEGTIVAYTYVGSGANIRLLDKVEVDPSGLDLETTYTYDSNFNVATVTDPRGYATTKTWDDRRRLTQVQAPSPLSYRTQYHHDGNGNRTSIDVENIDKDGNVVSGNQWLTTTYTYTNTDDVASITEEITTSTTRTTTFDYDNNQNRIRVTKPEGNKEAWAYNEHDWVISHTRGETDSAASTEEYTYDENGNRLNHEDGRDKLTIYTYDLFDRLTKTTNALNHYTELTLDKVGRVTQEDRKDSSNNLIQRLESFYDERGRLWKTEGYRDDPTAATFSDAATITERFKTGAVKKVTNARNKDTTYAYDTAWRLTLTTDAIGNEFANTYDAAGNKTGWSIEEVDGGSTVTHSYSATFDAINRRLTKVEIDRTNGSNTYTTTYAHDSRGNLVWLVNAEGNPTRWTFDGIGRMIKREVALTVGSPIETFTSAQVTEWGFDANSRMTSHKDDGTNTSTWAYDALDRATTMTYPDSSYAAYTYDKSDNVTQTIDPAGNDIDDTFDDLNRNTVRSVTRASGFIDTTTETRTYDAVHRMLTNEDDDYKVEYTYAVVGLESILYEESQSYVGGTAYTKTLTKTYDEVGNKATEAYPSGMNLSYTYNDIDMYSSISDGTNTIASWSYVGLRPKIVTYQNGTTSTYTYGGFREDVTTLKHETSTPTTILQLDYGYNKVHDRTYERYGASGSSGDAFDYDKMRRQTVAWMGSATPSSPSGVAYTKKIEYNYDDDGNRTSVVTTPYGQSPATTSYTTNSLYEYSAVGGTSWTWDTNGNCTNNGTYKFEYNYKNLICKVRDQSNNLIATYKYDANGRRVEKVVQGGITERYVYSGLETVATYNGSNTWKQDFAFGQSIDEVLMLEQADVLDYDSDSNTTETTRSFYHRNALGSVMQITDMNQTAVESFRYTPYGDVTITRNSQTQSTDPLKQHWSFTARFFDEESRLHYLRSRMYEPVQGRFLQRDPLGYAIGPSLFEYCKSNPASIRDPLGQSPLDDILEWLNGKLDRFQRSCRLLRRRIEGLPRRIAEGATDLAASIANALDGVPNELPPIDFGSKRDDEPDKMICTCTATLSVPGLKEPVKKTWTRTDPPCISDTESAACDLQCKADFDQWLAKARPWVRHIKRNGAARSNPPSPPWPVSREQQEFQAGITVNWVDGHADGRVTVEGACDNAAPK